MDTNEKIISTLASAHCAMYEWDIEAGTINWLGYLQHVLGSDDMEQLLDVEYFLSCIHIEDQEKLKSSLAMAEKLGGEYNRNYRFRLKDGSIIPVIDRGAIKTVDGKKYFMGMITSSVIQPPLSTIIASYTNIPQDIYSESRYSQAMFLLSLSESFKTKPTTEKHNIALQISIDNLAMLISWYSTTYANRVMAALECQLANLLRHGDSIHRTALDRFGMVLLNHSDSEVDLVIDRILKSIQLYNNPSFEEPLHLRCSIGSVRCSSHAEDADDALNKSYLALCNAKTKSSDFYVDYQQALEEHLNFKFETGHLHKMQSAFREKKIRIAFQPVISANNGKTSHYECLLRLENHDNEIESLGSAIPVAEKMGIIDVVDQYVLEECVKELTEHPEVRLAFNVSNMTTNNPRWLKLCTKILRDKPDVAKRLMVEITETAAQNDLRQTAYFVAALQELGCLVALDDFGAGYTGFRQLKSLSVDVIKIDGSFVIGLENNHENQIFIRSLLNFTHSYGLDTIAECVENGEVSKILMDLGVEFMQGYFFGPPILEKPWKIDA